MGKKSDKIFDMVAKSYDTNAEKYSLATMRELRELTLKPSLIHYLGDLSGKRVLDLGCGTGSSSRLSINCGAQEVVAIDISRKEISIAREIDAKKNIKYLIRNAIEDLSDLGKFDLVTAILAVHYCSSRNMLERYFSNVKQVLKSESVFIAVVAPFYSYEGYGIKIHSLTSHEGCLSNVTLSDFKGIEFLNFNYTYWSIKTYQDILEKVGFSAEWIPCLVSSDGIEKYGNDFWSNFIDNPLYKIFRAKLQRT